MDIVEIAHNPALYAGIAGGLALYAWNLIGRLQQIVCCIGIFSLSAILLDSARQTYTAVGVSHMDALANIMSAYFLGVVIAIALLCIAGPTWTAITRR